MNVSALSPVSGPMASAMPETSQTTLDQFVTVLVENMAALLDALHEIDLTLQVIASEITDLGPRQQGLFQ